MEAHKLSVLPLLGVTAGGCVVVLDVVDVVVVAVTVGGGATHVNV